MYDIEVLKYIIYYVCMKNLFNNSIANDPM